MPLFPCFFEQGIVLAQAEVYLSRHPSCGRRSEPVGQALVTVDFVSSLATTPPTLSALKTKQNILLLSGQSLMGANATSDYVEFGSGHLTRVQEATEEKGISWEQAIPRESQQEDCENRKGTQKESQMVRCTLLNGST